MNIRGFRHHTVGVDDTTGHGINHVNIHAVIGGDGPPLVLLHGYPQTWWEWRRVMPTLATTHTVIALDLRGAGDSDSPQGGYDKARMAEDVHGVMSALGYAQYAVCGHDIGAMVALALASTHRDAVTHLVVLDASMPGWSGWEQNFTDPRNWHFAFHQKRDLPERLIFGREYDYVSTFLADRSYDHGAHDAQDIQEFARAMAQPGNTRGGLEWYRTFATDHANGLQWKKEPLSMPVLALGGEHRYGPQILNMLSEFATNVTGGSIPGCAHWLVEENPADTADAILTFLERKNT